MKVFGLAHRAVLLAPAEDAFGHFAAGLRDLVAAVAGGARISRAVSLALALSGAFCFTCGGCAYNGPAAPSFAAMPGPNKSSSRPQMRDAGTVVGHVACVPLLIAASTAVGARATAPHIVRTTVATTGP
jgi:hypothetical protein